MKKIIPLLIAFILILSGCNGNSGYGSEKNTKKKDKDNEVTKTVQVSDGKEKEEDSVTKDPAAKDADTDPFVTKEAGSDVEGLGKKDEKKGWSAITLPLNRDAQKISDTPQNNDSETIGYSDLSKTADPVQTPVTTPAVPPITSPTPFSASRIERIKVKDVEGEVLKIRKIYNNIEDNRSKKYYTVKEKKSGVKEYLDPDSLDVICMVIAKGTDGIAYTRYYYFNNGGLMFAYLEAGDAHRLYFKDGFLFRWRYTPDSKNVDKGTYHDNEDSEEFLKWEDFAIREANTYVKVSSYDDPGYSNPTPTQQLTGSERKAVKDVEGEVLNIRKIYNEIEDNRYSGYYKVKEVKSGVKEYIDPYSSEIICMIISKGTDSSKYSRYYYFDKGMLIFVYLEGSDAHRLYFKDGYLFRWRYSSNSKKPEDSVYHDNEISEEFLKWERFVTGEANNYVKILVP